MEDQSFDALTRQSAGTASRRGSLLTLGAASVVAVLATPFMAAARGVEAEKKGGKKKKKNKNQNQAQPAPQECPSLPADLCPGQVQPCIDTFTPLCAGQPCEGFIACCPLLAECDFTGFFACTERASA